MFTGIPPFDEATRLDPKFLRTIYRGDLQGYLEGYGMPPLTPPVSEGETGCKAAVPDQFWSSIPSTTATSLFPSIPDVCMFAWRRWLLSSSSPPVCVGG